MLKHLLPLIEPHVCYGEVFAGGLAMLMAKDRSPVEVINDINGDLVALYRNVQYHLPAILEELQFFFSSRKTLRDFTAQPGITEIQRAARFLLRNRTSFGGNMNSFAVAKTAGGGAAFSRARNTEQLPYERFLENYDSKDTFFFVDPPYINGEVDALGRAKGKWVLTVDDSALNRELFDGCRIRALQSRSGAVNHRTSAKMFGELIIQP